jgi:succinate-semialdehyde dehydrogenase/glutarate-semialdehyde dehydrogenase
MKTETLFFINPATGSGFGEIKMTPVEEVEKAVNDMRQAFPIWSAKTLKEHIKILQKIQATLIDPQDEITRVLNQDCGKSRQDGLI